MSSIINSKRKVRVCTPHKPLLLSLPDCSMSEVTDFLFLYYYTMASSRLLILAIIMITLSFSSIDVAVATRHLLPPTCNILGFTVPPNLPDPPFVRLPPLPPTIPSVPSPPSSIPLVSFPTRAASSIRDYHNVL